jgi:hypothetical protein
MYRQAIERLAFRYKKSEAAVAECCLECAKKGHSELDYPNHVGSYLLGKGFAILKVCIRQKEIPTTLKKENRSFRFLLYFGSGSIFFLLLNGFLVYVLHWVLAIASLTLCLGLVVLLLPFTIELGLRMTNDIVTRLLPVHRIPAMDYRLGVPDGARSFVTIPVIVDNKEQGLEYLQRLHARYLANPQRNIYYALLVDYADATIPDLAVDEDIKHALIKHIDRLNEAYPSKYRIFS